MADDERGPCCLFVIRAVAGWEGEAVWLRGQEGWEEEEKCDSVHMIQIGMFKTFL